MSYGQVTQPKFAEAATNDYFVVGFVIRAVTNENDVPHVLNQNLK